MSLLETYEQQYAVSTADFTSKIAKLSSGNYSEKSYLVQELDKQIVDLKELLEQMELEVHEAEHSIRPKLRTRIDSYRVELTRLEQEFKIKSSSNSNDGYTSQTETFGEVSLKEEQKQRLLESSDRFERSNNKLAATYSILLETEEIGNSVLRDLSTQRETIQNSRSRLRDTDADLTRGSRLLNSMISRSRQQKLILTGMASMFIIIVIFSLYYTFSN